MIPRHLILDWNNEKLWQFAVTSSTYNYWDVFQKPLGRSQKLEVETSPPGWVSKVPTKLRPRFGDPLGSSTSNAPPSGCAMISNPPKEKTW